MKQLLVKIALRLAVWAFDYAYNAIDRDNDGKISKAELMKSAEWLDKRSRNLRAKLSKR